MKKCKKVFFMQVGKVLQLHKVPFFFKNFSCRRKIKKITTVLQDLKQTVIKGTSAGVLSISLLEVTIYILSEGRFSDVYMKICDELVTPLL